MRVATYQITRFPSHLASFPSPPQLCGEKKSPSDQGPLVGLLKDMHYAPEQVFKY